MANTIYVFHDGLKLAYKFNVQTDYELDIVTTFFSMFKISRKFSDCRFKIIDISIIRENGYYACIVNDGQLKAKHNDLCAILTSVFSNPYKFVQSKDFLYLHGCLLKNPDNKSIGIVAKTFGGKSTLAAILSMQKSNSYLSDDIIIVNDKLETLAYPMPLKLRKNKNIIHDCSEFSICDNEECDLLVNLSCNSITDQKYTLDALLFLNRVNKDCFDIKQCDTTKIIKSLFINQAHYQLDNPMSLKIIKEISEKVKCFDCMYNKCSDLVAFINSL